MNATDQGVTAPADPIFAAIEARIEMLEAKIATALDDCDPRSNGSRHRGVQAAPTEAHALTQTSSPAIGTGKQRGGGGFGRPFSSSPGTMPRRLCLNGKRARFTPPARCALLCPASELPLARGFFKAKSGCRRLTDDDHASNLRLLPGKSPRLGRLGSRASVCRCRHLGDGEIAIKEKSSKAMRSSALRGVREM